MNIRDAHGNRHTRAGCTAQGSRFPCVFLNRFIYNKNTGTFSAKNTFIVQTNKWEEIIDMKNHYFILTVILAFSILLSASAALADGLAPVTNRQSYPIPQIYPIGQYPNQNNYQGPAAPNPQYQYQPPQSYNQQPWQYEPQPQYYNPQPWQYEPQPQYYYPQQPWQQQENPPQSYYYNQDPIYDPYSGMYYYRLNDYQGPFPYQPSGSGYQNRNVQTSRQTNYDGSVNLNWVIRNVTNEEWGKKNVDIKCTSGCHLLTNPNQTLWDIPYSVPRNGTLSFTVRIWQPMYGETMTFSIIAGSKTLYTFNVNPN